MTTLYSLRCESPDGQPNGNYRITKFVDGEPEGSYLVTERECECPAGPRPTCRHRQMLPQMLHDGIANTHWFLEWDNKRGVVDFNGASKRLYDELAAAETITQAELILTATPVGEAQHVEKDTAPKRRWRRL